MENVPSVGRSPSLLIASWRKVRDSNPRYPERVYRISSPARSITLPTFLRNAGAKVVIFFVSAKYFSEKVYLKLKKSQILHDGLKRNGSLSV